MAIAKLDLGNVKGEQGVDGQAATITIGSVKTGDTGTPATVTNSGDERDAILNFTLPRGERGESGIGMPASGEQPNSLLLCDEHTRTKWVTIDEAARTLFNQQSSIRAEALKDGETLDNYRLTSDRPRSVYYCPTDAQAAAIPNAPITTKFLLYVGYPFGTKDCISQTVVDAATGQRWYRIYWLTGGTWTSWRLLDVDCYSKTQTYTQDEINQRLAQKANNGTVYTTAQTYSKSEVDSKLSAKADYSQIYRRSETYTRSEIDAKDSTKADKADRVQVQYGKWYNINVNPVQDIISYLSYDPMTGLVSLDVQSTYKFNNLPGNYSINLMNDPTPTKLLPAANQFEVSCGDEGNVYLIYSRFQNEEIYIASNGVIKYRTWIETNMSAWHRPAVHVTWYARGGKYLKQGTDF